MLFVRNPTGVSHSPAEHADLEDCHAGVKALEAAIRELVGVPTDQPGGAAGASLDGPVAQGSATDGALH